MILISDPTVVGYGTLPLEGSSLVPLFWHKSCHRELHRARGQYAPDLGRVLKEGFDFQGALCCQCGKLMNPKDK